MISSAHLRPYRFVDNMKIEAENCKLKEAIQRYYLEYVHNEDKLLMIGNASPFVTLLFLAFERHNNVKVTADDLHLVIMQNFVIWIKSIQTGDDQAKQDSLRKIINVNPDQATEEIIIQLDSEDWPTAIPLFMDAIKSRINPVMQSFAQDYSTSEQVNKMAKGVTLMDMTSDYFHFTLRTRCGIAGINFEGIKQDYEKLFNMLDAIDAFKSVEPALCDWTNSIRKILQTICDIFDNKLTKEQETKFVVDCFKYNEISGNYAINGWITNLFFIFSPNKGETNYQLRNNKTKTEVGLNLTMNDFLKTDAKIKVKLLRPDGTFTCFVQAGHVGIKLDENDGNNTTMCMSTNVYITDVVRIEE